MVSLPLVMVNVTCSPHGGQPREVHPPDSGYSELSQTIPGNNSDRESREPEGTAEARVIGARVGNSRKFILFS